ncbi:hypothetical protein GWI33_002076 [Rhynchophorus ferrugineus]|uniref:Major facilitator superfamily associated domain-containing protein n=1 Tax=Rhynchophorus ferrugineus TaxID=354439 RepID=A0A834IZP5_RHYFE|nr:hypothetical protein GWI33_002076 [Rhynchophorus ferrugineus]
MEKVNRVNKNLISLKCVIFLFFGAIGALLPFLPLQMNIWGLSRNEAVIVSYVSPLIAVIGPLVAGPLADRLAGGFGGAPRSKTGRYLRVMIAVSCLLATIFYWLLLTIPPIIRSPPNAAFACDEQGGYILQDRCGAERTCYNWGSGKGAVFVKNCIFSCNATSAYRGESKEPKVEEVSSEYSDGDYEATEPTIANEPEGFAPNANSDNVFPELYPHMCYKNISGDTVCEVYTDYSWPIRFNLGLRPSDNVGNESEDTCKYPFDEYFHCRIPPIKSQLIKEESGDEDCNPVILCEIHDPYNSTDSLLKRSQCGYDNISFWLYLFIKSLADTFLAAAVALIGTAVVIATRETSTGRGDIGKQFAVGALGFAIFAPIIGGCADGKFLEAMICFTVLMVIAVIVVLVDEKMPLSPPEWWWHTSCGLLALPMSAVRKYGLETVALGIILFLLGIFWNTIDTYLPWHIVKMQEGEPLVIGLTVTIGALPAVVFLYYAEKIVDYCGHSNILIFCFVNYICHHLTLISVENAKLLLLCEFLEVFTLHIMYVTAILYLRHLVPRKFTACGQALPVIAHFCLGRCFGALLGSLAYDEYPYNFNRVHQGFTVAAAIVALLYYITYHFYLKPKCGAPLHTPPDPAPATIQNMNGNGSYTPLRVYHNSKSKKGHFRY